jgi:hypothetical protein
MNQIIFNSAINDFQIGILLHLFQSWNVKAEIVQPQVVSVKQKKKPLAAASKLPFSAGMWADYDVDDKTLRTKAWGTSKRVAL